MIWVIGFCTFLLVIDCLLLVLLVLIQLPKKEAGLGTAFGGGATDALFGAGTGTALTKITKYAAGIFFVLTLGLSVLNAQLSKSRKTEFLRGMATTPAQTTPAGIPVPSVVPAPAPAETNGLLSSSATNVPSTNAPSRTNAPAPREEEKAPENN